MINALQLIKEIALNNIEPGSSANLKHKIAKIY